MFTRSRSTGTETSSTAGPGARSAVVGLSLVSATAVVLSFAPIANAAPASGTDLVKGECPALFGLGVQGTGQSAPDAAPTTDTGMLSQVFMPMIAKAVDGDKELAGRAYVPYEAGFGGAVPGGNVPYSQSVEGGLQNLRDMASEVAAACPDTKFTVAGYSQGAHVVSLFAEEVGKGSGVIAADKVVGVATFGDPTRAAGAPPTRFGRAIERSKLATVVDFPDPVEPRTALCRVTSASSDSFTGIFSELDSDPILI